jgi:hypothetical protein
MSESYEVGTRAWQPDPDEGWVPSEVEQKLVDGNKIRLVFRLENGKVSFSCSRRWHLAWRFCLSARRVDCQKNHGPLRSAPLLQLRFLPTATMPSPLPFHHDHPAMAAVTVFTRGCCHDWRVLRGILHLSSMLTGIFFLDQDGRHHLRLPSWRSLDFETTSFDEPSHA